MFTLLNGKIKCTDNPDVLRPTEDALWLAAAVPVADEDTLAMDVGTGSGAAAFALMQRCPNLNIMGIDNDPAALELATENAALNAMSARFSTHKATVGSDALPIFTGQHIIANPPFFDADQGFHSKDPARIKAFESTKCAMCAWFDALATALPREATLTIILHANYSELAEEQLCAKHGLGGDLIWLHTKPQSNAKRIILRLNRQQSGLSPIIHVEAFDPATRKAVLEDGLALG